MGLSVCRWLETYSHPLGLGESWHSSAAVNDRTNSVWSTFIDQSGNQLSPRPSGSTSTVIRGIASRLAQEICQEQATVFDLAVLAELLELPFPRAWQLLPHAVLVTAHVIRQLSRRRPLQRNEGTWLSFQITYLRAIDQLLHQEAQLRRPWLDTAYTATPVDRPLSATDTMPSSLTSLIATLRPSQLTDTQAEQALTIGAQSLLVKQIHQVVIQWLVFNGTEEREAELLVQRMEHGAAGHLLATIVENATPLAQLQKFVRLGQLATWSNASPPVTDYEVLEDAVSPSFSVDPQQELYRARIIQSLSEPILGQPFGLQEIYIPPKGQRVGASSAIDVMTWVLEQLNYPHNIILIEGRAGQGKTSFCKMLALRVALTLYPSWMPLEINLRGLQLGASLEETIAPALPEGLFTQSESWLNSSHPPCLLILDGLDELPLNPEGEDTIAELLAQVFDIQQRYREANGQPRHRIVLTSSSRTSSMALPMSTPIGGPIGAPGQVPMGSPLNGHQSLQLERVVLQSMDQEDLRQWFLRWAALQTKPIAQSYFNFLKRTGAFRTVGMPPCADWLHRPFVLLVVGLLFRDGLVDSNLLDQSCDEVRFEVFDRLITWLISSPTDATYPQPGIIPDISRMGPAHASRSPDAIANLLAGRSPRQVRQELQQVILLLLQSGRGRLSRRMLTEHYDIQADHLPMFYLSPSRTDSDGLTVSIPTMSEHNASEAIAFQLRQLTQRRQTSHGEVFELGPVEAIAAHLYPILGCGPFNGSLLGGIIERLRRDAKQEASGFSIEVLCDRLREIFQLYSTGRWLDDGIAQQSHLALRALGNPASLLQVDAAFGLNLFLLLSQLHPELNRRFQPVCGEGNRACPNRLTQLINRTTVLSPIAFWHYARKSLISLDLNRANLDRAFFAEARMMDTTFDQASLNRTIFSGANLMRASFKGASCRQAIFSGADLRGADFQGADLQNADLRGTTLGGANFANACLANTLLDETGRAHCIQSGAFMTVEQYQAYHQAVQLEHQAEAIVSGDETIAAIYDTVSELAVETEKDPVYNPEDTITL
jgi:hypothetical protein